MMKCLFNACLVIFLLARIVHLSARADPRCDVDKRRVKGTPATEEAESQHSWDAHRPYVHFLEAKLKISQGKYRESLREAEAITAKTPEEESLKLILMGQSYEGLLDSAHAFAAYDKAQAVTPLCSAAILRRGVLQYKMGDLVEAERQLSRYVRLEPGNPEVFYYLFLLSLAQDDARDTRAKLARKVSLLDGPNGFWSTELLKTVRKNAKPQKVEAEAKAKAEILRAGCEKSPAPSPPTPSAPSPDSRPQ